MSIVTTKPSSKITYSPTTLTYQYVGCYGDRGDARSMDLNVGIVGSIHECYIIALSKGYIYYGLQYGGECWLSNHLANAEKYGQCGVCSNCQNTACNCENLKCRNGDNCGDGFGTALYKITLPTSGPSLKPTQTSIPSSKPTISPIFPTALPTKYKSTMSPSVIVTNVPTTKPSPKITYSPTPFSYQYVGCYGDRGDARSMDLNVGIVGSNHECYNIALSKGYIYYGLQYGGECWLSNHLANAEKYGQCGVCSNCQNTACNCENLKCRNGDNCGDGFGIALYMITLPTSGPSFKPTQTSIPSSKPTISPSIFPTTLNITASSNPSITPSKAPSKNNKLYNVNTTKSPIVGDVFLTSSSSSSKALSTGTVIGVTIACIILLILIFICYYILYCNRKRKQKEVIVILKGNKDSYRSATHSNSSLTSSHHNLMKNTAFNSNSNHNMDLSDIQNCTTFYSDHDESGDHIMYSNSSPNKAASHVIYPY